MNPFEILQKTPKTNCGQCGHPTCLAFSVTVAKGGEDPAKCPFIDLSGLNIKQKSSTDLENLSTERDLALVAHLKKKIAGHDFSLIAGALGADYDPNQPDTLLFSYLGQDVRLSKKEILINGTEPEDPRDRILLYNYVFAKGGRVADGNWVGLESLPNSISKVKTLALYCEDRLAKLFSERPLDLLRNIGSRLDGAEVPDSSASFGIIIPVLPRIPQYVLFWEAEPEDGFDAKVKVLFDHHVLDFLDIESLVFSAERLADKFAELLEQQG